MFSWITETNSLKAPAPAVEVAMTARILLACAACLGWQGCQGQPDEMSVPVLTMQELESLEPSARTDLEAARTAAQRGSQDPDAHGRLAMLFHAHGFLEAAASSYSRAQTLAPREARWRRLDAHRAAEAGEEGEALERASRAIELDPGSVAARTALAQLELRRARFEEARKHFRAALEREPDSFTALRGMGTLEFRTGNFAEAVRFLEQALAVESSDPNVHYTAALAFARLGETRRADEHLAASRRGPARRPAIEPPAEILALRGRGVRAALAAGTELFERGRYDEAVAALEQAVAAEPGSADVQNALAAALEQAGDLERAQHHYEEAVSLEPTLAVARKNLGVLFGRLGRWDEAIGQLEEAVRLDPRQADTHQVLAAALVSAGRFDEALAHAREAIALAPDMAHAHFTLGVALEATGRTGDAVAAFQSAVSHDPGTARAHLRLGVLLGSDEQLDEARLHLQTAIQLEPESGEAHHYLSVALRRLGNTGEAIEHERRAIALAGAAGSGDLLGTAHYTLGLMLQETGDPVRALSHFQQALTHYPENTDILSELARTHHLSGNHGAAIEGQRRVVAAQPAEADAHYRLGVFLAASGDRAGARRAFQDSLRAMPGFAPAVEAIERLNRERGERPPRESYGSLALMSAKRSAMTL